MAEPSRDALLDAARALFLARGFGGVSMAEIRLQAQVSNGSLFHHFPSKAHLARALYLESLQRYQQALLARIGAPVAAQAGVEGLIETHLRWVAAHSDEAQVLTELREATRIDGIDVDWSAANAEAFETLREWVRARTALGEMRQMPADVWMALVFGPVLQLTRGWVQKRPISIPKAVRDALMHAAWASVRPVVSSAQPAPTKKRSRGQ